MMHLCFDTETTGKADFKAPHDAPHQPRIVQLGAILLDEDYEVRGEINIIIKPDGWTIPKEASDIHGITQEIAEKCGIPKEVAFRTFFALLDMDRDKLVAHNISFDLMMLKIEFAHSGATPFEFPSERQFCTMHNTTEICKLPGRFGNFKWPKLQEAHLALFGVEFEGAHDAMADVRACSRIYRHLTEPPKPTEPQPQLEPQA